MQCVAASKSAKCPLNSLSSLIETPSAFEDCLRDCIWNQETFFFSLDSSCPSLPSTFLWGQCLRRIHSTIVAFPSPAILQLLFVL